jgi:hypothetical protein
MQLTKRRNEMKLNLLFQILLSVMSLVAEPNINSPANVDAAKMWRDNREEFVKVSFSIMLRPSINDVTIKRKRHRSLRIL